MDGKAFKKGDVLLSAACTQQPPTDGESGLRNANEDPATSQLPFSLVFSLFSCLLFASCILQVTHWIHMCDAVKRL